MKRRTLKPYQCKHVLRATDKHNIKQVLVNGVDVTCDCFEVNLKRGFVKLIVRTGKVTALSCNGELVWYKLRGKVKVIYK